MADKSEMSGITADKPQRRSTAEQRKVDSEIRAMFEHRITFNEFLGFRIEKLSTENIRVVFDMRPELVGHYLYGRLHGGVISAVLDTTGGLAAISMSLQSDSGREIATGNATYIVS